MSRVNTEVNRLWFATLIQAQWVITHQAVERCRNERVLHVRARPGPDTCVATFLYCSQIFSWNGCFDEKRLVRHGDFNQRLSGDDIHA